MKKLFKTKLQKPFDQKIKTRNSFKLTPRRIILWMNEVFITDFHMNLFLHRHVVSRLNTSNKTKWRIFLNAPLRLHQALRDLMAASLRSMAAKAFFSWAGMVRVHGAII